MVPCANGEGIEWSDIHPHAVATTAAAIGYPQRISSTCRWRNGGSGSCTSRTPEQGRARSTKAGAVGNKGKAAASVDRSIVVEDIGTHNANKYAVGSCTVTRCDCTTVAAAVCY